MKIKHPILAILTWLGAGYLATIIGTTRLSSVIILFVCALFMWRGLSNMIENSHTKRIDWGIFEVDRASLILILVFFIVGIFADQNTNIDIVANYVVIGMGAVVAYKFIARKFFNQ